MDAEQVKKQAQDENTPPGILSELATSKNKEILRCVAGNPNTPVKTLEKLGAKFPDEIIGNPIFDLLLLENSENKFVLLSLARASTTSVEKLKELAICQDRKIVEAIIKNSKSDADVLDMACENFEYKLPLKIFLENKNTGDITLSRLIFRHSNLAESDYRSILEHPNASEMTINIIKLKNNCQNLSPFFLEKFASYENRNIRNLVSRYPRVSAKVLAKLSSDDDIWIRENVAVHPNTSIETIEKLARNENRFIRKKIAINTKTPIEVINNLVQDDDPKVRGAVASRKDISEENAFTLAHDISIDVIEKLFTNSDIPTEIASILDKYHEYNRFSMHRKTSKFNKFGMSTKYFRELSEIIIPEQIANRIAERKNNRVQRLLATNQNLSASTFDKLWKYHSFNIHLGFIYNINTPLEILEELSTNINDLIRIGVAEHPKVTIKILDKLKDDRNIGVREKVAQSSKISLEITKYLARDSTPLVRRAIAENPKTPANVLDNLKSDRSIGVRLAVARNPNSFITTLKELLNDEALKIVESAKDNLEK